MKKLLLTLLVGIFLLSLASAQVQTLGTFQQHRCVELTQTCSNCSSNNITAVTYPNSTVALSDVVMTKSGTKYNSSFCATDLTGQYIVNGVGDPDGEITVWAYDFYVTPSGDKGVTGYYFLILAIAFIFILIGYYKEDYAISILGTFGLYFIGIWMLYYGIDIYKNFLTNAFAFIILGIAGYITTMLAIEYINSSGY